MVKGQGVNIQMINSVNCLRELVGLGIDRKGKAGWFSVGQGRWISSGPARQGGCRKNWEMWKHLPLT